MAYPVWPDTLPACVMQEGFSNGGEQPVNRQEMEAGLPRVTRISSTTPRYNSYSILCDERQLAEFWSFYENSANAGADFVLMPMMTANKLILHTCRISSYPTMTRHGLKWRVSFSLETGEQHINWS